MAVNSVHSTQRAQQTAGGWSLPIPGRFVIGLLFLVALIAFEIFNFDTTQFALRDFLGTASFAGIQWATVLAVAFCAIDFAGLLRFFLPEDDQGEAPVEVWYLMAAWLLGATMNALMTWWAVNLTLLNHEFGNEVLSRQQLLEIVPIFVALLVWLTRILFIGAFTVAGGYLFDFDSIRSESRANRARPDRKSLPSGKKQAAVPLTLRPIPGRAAGRHLNPVTDEVPPFLREEDAESDEPSDREDATGAEDVVTAARSQRVAPTRIMRRDDVAADVAAQREG